MSIFGEFDVDAEGTGGERYDPLYFTISRLTGYAEEDLIDLFYITNADGYTMAVHVGDIGPFDGIDSAFFSDGGTPVPEPATMLLLGTGLVGLAGFSRKKFRK